MTTPNNAFPWYTEHRSASPEKITLDLSRHLQRRITVGPVVIITDRPSVTLPVLRRRWVRLIAEVERQYASTLEHRKKHSLQHELARLRACTFSVDPLSFVHVHCITPADIELAGTYNTAYILTDVTEQQVHSLLRCVEPNGLLVAYRPDTFPEASTP